MKEVHMKDSHAVNVACPRPTSLPTFKKDFTGKHFWSAILPSFEKDFHRKALLVCPSITLSWSIYFHLLHFLIVKSEMHSCQRNATGRELPNERGSLFSVSFCKRFSLL